jgi:elongator complex protein 2
MLSKLCNIEAPSSDRPDAANIPVLGLSNKAIQAVDETETAENVADDDDDREAIDPASTIKKSTLDFDHPPFEDHLARHLLWPETEKLYGHGYEISAMTVSSGGSLVATACRASSIDHAVIRLYDTKEWLEIKPPLKAHSLTVTALQFSPDDKYLLSAGRDRQWVVWEKGVDAVYALKSANPKGHSRMILGAAWAALEKPTFLTAGRDKSVKIWQIDNNGVELKGSVVASAAVTAVACNREAKEGTLQFAYGTEGGELVVGSAEAENLDKVAAVAVEMGISPAKGINQIVWRPGRHGERQQMAVASEDSSVRIFNVE